MIQTRIDSAALETAMAAISRKIAHRADLLDDVGAAITESVRATFIASASPYGQRWAPLKTRKGQPLRDTGRLMNSITHQESRDEVVVGTNVVYGPIHNFGGQIEHAARSIRVRLRKTRSGRTQFAKDSHKRATTVWGEAKPWTVRIPARPFFPNQAQGLPAPWESQVVALIGRFIEPAAGGK